VLHQFFVQLLLVRYILCYDMSNPKVFFDITIGGTAAGRIEIEVSKSMLIIVV